MATILGVLSIITLFYMVFKSYRLAGDIPQQYGATCILILVFTFTGIILGVVGKMERDKYVLFPYLGIGLNVLALLFISLILYTGAYA